jgi:hypothetical protein
MRSHKDVVISGKVIIPWDYFDSWLWDMKGDLSGHCPMEVVATVSVTESGVDVSLEPFALVAYDDHGGVPWVFERAAHDSFTKYAKEVVAGRLDGAIAEITKSVQSRFDTISRELFR